MAANVGSFDKSLKVIKFACDLSGLSLGKEHMFFYKVIFWINFLWVNTDVAGSIGYVIGGMFSGKAFIELTYGGPCAIISVLANYKTLSIIFNYDKLFKLFDSIRKIENKSMEEKNGPAEDLARDDVNFLHSLIRVLNISNILLVVAFTLNPLGIMAYHYLQSKEVELRLPLFIWYPFDPYDMRFYSFVYFHQSWSTGMVIVWLCAVDYIFYVCCTYFRIQFRILEREFENVVTVKMGDKDFKAKFLRLVERHQELIKCTDTLEEIYSKSTLCNFVSSSLLICLTGFDVMMITDTLLVLTFASFLATSLFQIFFFCFFGDRLMRSSIAVGDGAYKSLWYMKDVSYGRALLLIQIRSQKACKLTAYGFADVHLPAFARILSNAWSYFALLNTMLN